MKKLLMSILLVLSINSFALYQLYDIEPARINVPQQYQTIFNFLIRVEGYHNNFYIKDGIKMIGYGDKSFQLSNPVNKNSMTENMARARLLMWITIYDKLLDAVITVPLTRGQRDALISYIYSTGNIPLFINSNIVRLLNQKKAYDEVPIEFRLNCTMPGSNQQSNYLKSRRSQEVSLWSSGN